LDVFAAVLTIAGVGLMVLAAVFYWRARVAKAFTLRVADMLCTREDKLADLQRENAELRRKIAGYMKSLKAITVKPKGVKL
jgi:hypothetical protein